MRRMPLLFPLIVWSLAASGRTPEANRTARAALANQQTAAE